MAGAPGESGGSGGSEEGSGGERDDRLGIGHCVADVLNVRSGPGTDYPVVYQISTGNMVDVLKISENGWLQINCLHGVGWCAAQYIQWSPFESQQPPIGIGRCTADVLNVRTGSGLDYPAAFQLSQGNMSMCSQPAASGFRSTAFWAPAGALPSISTGSAPICRCPPSAWENVRRMCSISVRVRPRIFPYCSLFPKAIWWMCWRITAEAGFGFDAFWVQAGAPLSILTGAGTTNKKRQKLSKKRRENPRRFSENNSCLTFWYGFSLCPAVPCWDRLALKGIGIMIVEKFRDNVGGWHAVVPVCLPAHRSGGDDDIEDHQYDQNPSDYSTGLYRQNVRYAALKREAHAS